MNDPAMQWPPSRAFVTGATGFVGYEIARQLTAAGVQVVALSRSGRLPGELQAMGVRVVRGDLSAVATLSAAMQRCQLVFHVAADVNMWRRRWGASVSTNVLGTRNIVCAALEAEVRRLVFTSTAATIGKPLDRSAGAPAVVDERSRYNFEELQMVYPHTKWLAEQEVLRGVGRGLDAVIMHPAAVLGPCDWKHNTLPLFTAPKRGITIAVPGGLRSICDVRDVATGHVLAAQRGRSGERYILGGESLSVAELFALICEEVGGTRPRFRLPDPLVLGLGRAMDFVADLSGRPPSLSWEMALQSTFRVRLSSAKAEQELGYATRSPRASVSDAVAWFRRRDLL